MVALALMLAPLAGCAGYRRAVIAEDHLAAGADAIQRRAWEEAGREFAAAAAARPDAGHLYARIGLAYQRAGRWREAIPWLEQGLELQSAQPWHVRLALMTCLEQARRFDDAEQVLRDALDAYFNDPVALNNLAYTAADRGMYLETAARLLRRAVQLAPDAGFIVDSLGWCYYQQGKLDRALALLTRAARLDDSNPEVLYHLGMALRAQGETQAAAEQFSAALTLNPSFTQAHKALTALAPEPEGRPSRATPTSPRRDMEQ